MQTTKMGSPAFWFRLTRKKRALVFTERLLLMMLAYHQVFGASRQT
jgi:hypothetical protein